MKARNPSVKATVIRAVLASLVLMAAICPAAPEAPRSPAPALVPQTAEEKPLRRVELLVFEDRPDEVTVGLHVELAPGWHLYWLNPGDAGLAPEVRWRLPSGYEAGKLRFPTPEKFVHGGIVTYGFTNEALILCPVRRPKVSTEVDRPTIIAELDWMACRESCITGKSTAQVNLSSLSPADRQRFRSIFARFSPRFPKPLNPADLTATQARLIKAPGRWTAEIVLSGRNADSVADFYPYPLDDFVIDHHGIAINRDKLIIPVEPANPSAALPVISGLLIIGETGYDISIPMEE